MSTQTVIAKRRIKRWPFVVIALPAIVGAALYETSQRLGPVLRDRVVEAIRDRYQSEVELKNFELRLLPRIHGIGEGLTLHLHGRTDIPPIVTVGKFSID